MSIRASRWRFPILLLLACAVSSQAVALAQEAPTKKTKAARTKKTKLESEAKALRRQNRKLKDGLDSLKATVERLEQRVQDLETQGKVLAIRDGIVMEYGSVLFDSNRKYLIKKIEFRNQYKSPPLVIVSESGTAGGWVFANSQRITTKQAEIAVRDEFWYRCRIGYIVIGEGKLRDRKKAKGRKKAKPNPEIRLTEDQRKRVHWEVVEAEYRAMYEADQKYPALNPAKPGFSITKATKQNERRRSLERKLTKKYVGDVAKQHSLAKKKLDQMQKEGEAKNWPVPPWKHGPPRMEEWP